MKFLILSIVLTLLSGCSVFDSEQNLEETLVIATANNPIFSVLNKTESPIVFLVVETEILSLIDLADPCTDFKPNLESNKNIQIKYADILGWDEDAKSVWFLWTDCKDLSFNKTIKL